MHFLLFSDDYMATHDSDVHVEPRIIHRSRTDQNPRMVRRQKSFESRSNSSDFNRMSNSMYRRGSKENKFNYESVRRPGPQVQRYVIANALYFHRNIKLMQRN